MDQRLRSAVEKGQNGTIEFYDQIIETLEKRRKNLLIKRTKFKLYVADSDRVNKLFTIVDGIVELEYVVYESFTELKSYTKQLKDAEISFIESYIDVRLPLELQSLPTIQQQEKYEKSVSYINELKQSCHNDLNKRFHAERNLLTPVIKEFQQYCSDVI